MKRSTFTHPKLYELAGRLGVSRAAAIGHLALLWDFAAIHCPGGDIGKWSNEGIARFCDWPGDPGAFIAAAVASHWLDRCRVHRLVVHDWEEHCEVWVRLRVRKMRLTFVQALPPVEGDPEWFSVEAPTERPVEAPTERPVEAPTERPVEALARPSVEGSTENVLSKTDKNPVEGSVEGSTEAVSLTDVQVETPRLENLHPLESGKSASVEGSAEGSAEASTPTCIYNTYTTDQKPLSPVSEPKQVPTAFERFWGSYPKGGRAEKRDSERAFARAAASTDPETIIAAAAAFASSELGRSRFCPKATTWLGLGRWQDDPASWRRGSDGDSDSGSDAEEAERMKLSADEFLAEVRQAKREKAARLARLARETERTRHGDAPEQA